MSQSVKVALKVLALNMAAELKAHGVAAVAITPGFLRSESMLQRFGVTEANWRDAGEEEIRLLLDTDDPFAESTAETLRTGKYVPLPAAGS